VSTYEFSADPRRVDRVTVHHWLSDLSYWARGRTREQQDVAIDNSRNYGVYDTETGAQLGYARIVTDGATFAWLCDVFVSPEVRGSGVGKTLMAGVVADVEPLGVRRVMLATADAHGLYAQFGFEGVRSPEKYMVLGAH
jgi:N-acetylglutamate synthase-like GNAT family acetyltransferase